MKIYISGGISDVPNYKEIFHNAEVKLTEQGHEVINPARVNKELPKSTTYRQYMKMCEDMIDMADAVYMMNGWEKSYGSKYERYYAELYGKELIYE